MANNRHVRLSKRNKSENRHLWLLLFWVVYGIWFVLVERGFSRTFHTVWCPVDDWIPFCEWFVIPYIIWYVFLYGMILYLLLTDVPAFRRHMYFIILTYGITMVIYAIYPTCQALRPSQFPRNNPMTWLIQLLYTLDTPTNVCPSMHVIGSVAVVFAAWDTRRFQNAGWRVGFVVTAILICLSTMFIKQHSAVDVLAGLLLCGLAYPVVYGKRRKASSQKQNES